MGKQSIQPPSDDLAAQFLKQQQSAIQPPSDDLASKFLASQKKNPNLSQNNMASSGETSSTDSGEETAGWLSGAYSWAKGLVKQVPSFAANRIGGLLELAAPAAQSELAAGYTAMSVADELSGKRKEFTPEEKKFLSATSGEMVEGTYQEVSKIKSKLLPEASKGSSDIFKLVGQGRVTNNDMEAIGATMADTFLQQATGAIPVVGQLLNFAGNFESRYDEARKSGISPDKALGESLVLAGVETEVERRLGVDKMIAAGFGKKMSREAIEEIGKKVLTREAFEETVAKTAKALSWENLKEGFIKGALPEFLEEAGQSYIDVGEKKLFDLYERKKKEDDPNAKLELYDPKDEEGLFSTKTLSGALNAGFWGGLTGQMGGMFVNSRSFNPSIYSTLQNAYDSQGKEGLGSAIEDIKKGLTKASESDKLSVDSYNNALKNVDKIANNISKFDQKSDIDNYARYSLFNIDENIVPAMSNDVAKDMAKLATPIEMPTPEQIDNDIENGSVTTVSYDQLTDVPDAYRSFADVGQDQEGGKVLQFQVPNSLVKAYTDNEMAVQTLMNNPLFAIKSLTDNNREITVEDLERIGLGGGAVFPSSAEQLQFKVKFEQNKPKIVNQIKTINYLKSVSNNIKETGKAPDALVFNSGLNNIYKYNTGDTVFYNNTAHKILETSSDGQKLKLSGIQEQVNASDENLKTQRQAEEAAVEQPTATTEANPKVTAPKGKKEEIESKIASLVDENGNINFNDFEEYDRLNDELKRMSEAEAEQTKSAEEDTVDFPSKTIGDAVYELTPYVYQGRTGRLQQQSNGLVTFETKDKVYELGNIADLKDTPLSEWGIVQQEMSTDKNFGVTIDGKTFTNKNQNPFAAITYDENGEAVSVKLQDDKGKTKTIKGARAQLIDAQYKERKILNESTDEQLNEVEQQVTARTEDIGNAEQAPTGGQVKPVEPAFTEKQRERQRAINEVAKRLAQKSDNMKNTNEAIANITSSLFTAGINVEVLTTEQIKAKYGSGNASAQGFFISEKGVIVINKNMVESEWGKSVVFHEATHPIINIIRNADPKAFKQLIKAIRDMRGDNATIDSIIKSIEAQPDYKGQFTQDDEIVVETIARIASGKLTLKELTPSLSQKIKDLINKIGKVLGFKQVLRDNNDVAFVKLANQISDVLNSGRDIAEIVGAKNVTNHSKSAQKYNLAVSLIEGRNEAFASGNLDKSSIEQASSIVRGKDVYSNKEVSNIPTKSLTEVFNEYNGKAVFINSDPTRVGEHKLTSGKSIFLYGGGDYNSLKENVDNNIGFATTQIGKVETYNKLVKNTFGENKGVTLVVEQAPTSVLSNSYTLRSVLDAISELPKSVRDSPKFKMEFFGEDIVAIKDAFGVGYDSFMSKYKSADFGSKDFIDELVSELAYKFGEINTPSSFKARRIFVQNLTAGIVEKSTRAGLQNEKGWISKDPKKFIAKNLFNEFGMNQESLMRSIARKEIVDSYFDNGDWGFVVSGFESSPDGDFKSIQDKGVVHPLFNAKFYGEKPFKLESFYKVDDIVPPTMMFESADKKKVYDKPYEKRASLMSSASIYYSHNINQELNEYGVQMSSIDRDTPVAPNGKPSNLNEYQYNAVRTPEFKAWFGDWENDPENASKIVDENGEPMVMYHGTSKDKDFDSFKISDRGAWFSSSPEEASNYASSNDSQKMKYDEGTRKYITTNTSSRVIPVFLNIKNLERQEDVDKNVLDEYRKAGYKSYRNAQKYLFNQVKYKNRNVEGFAFDTREAGAAYNYAQVIVLFDGKSIEQDNGTYKWFGNEFNVKSAIGSKFSPTNPKIQMSNIDREYTPEGTVADAGMTMAERKAWQDKNGVSQRQERNPIVQQAAKALSDGLTTLEEYVDVVRRNMPIFSMPTVPKIPTFKEIVGALNEGALSKAGIVGLNKTFADGERVASRLDIPAYNYYDTWVVSIHDGVGDKTSGKVLGYGQTAVLKNVVFKTSAKGGLGIAIDRDKTTIARIFGDWTNEAPEAVHKRATELMNDPAWTQVGMNPYRHSFFYDKSDGTAVISADEVIQVGALVLAKNVVKAPIGSESFKNHFTFVNNIGQEIQFSNMSRDDQRINTLRNEYYNNDVPADVLIEAAKKEYGLDQAAAEALVSKATGSVLDLAPYETDSKAELGDEKITPEVQEILDEYTTDYENDKKQKLAKESKKTTFADIAVKLYDSKFKIRRILQSLSDMQTLSSAKLRNIMGKAKASSMEAQQAIARIYGGLSESQIRIFDQLNFALRVIQVDKNNNEKVYKEYDNLRKQFIKENNGKMPNEKQLEDLMAEARNLVPNINHGLLDNTRLYTAADATKFIDKLRNAYSTEDFDNLMSRAAEYKKVGNESVAKMLKAGMISQEVADKYKDDFYTFRKTLERYYDDYSSNVPIYYKDGVAYYSAFKSLGEGSKESYFQRDSRVLLAENILIVNKAIAKNDLRKSIFNDIMINPKNFFENNDNVQRVIKTKEGGDLSFAFKPAVYERDKDGKVKKEASGYVVKPAQDGFVNVPFRVDGSLQYFQMEKELYDEVEGLNTAFNPQDSNLVMQAYYGASNVANKVLTASQTRYNPLFFWRNMSMDIRHQVHFTDYWTSDKNFLVSNVYSAYGRLLFKSIANTKKIFANDENMVKLLEEATEVGLFMDTYSEAREQIKRSSEIDTYAVVDGKPSKWDRFKTGVAAMNVKTEIAMRVSAYEQAKKHLTEEYKKLHNVTELNEAQLEEIKEIASAQARGYTDFAQKGTVTPQLNYAYLNASIQGLGSAIEYSYDNPAKTLRKTSELFVGHMIWTTMLMMAIPDLYDELDEYTKDIYMLSPTGFAMKKIKDSLGLPSSFIPASKIDPTLVPIMGVARRTAEHFVKSMRGEKTEPITYEETARLINIALPSIFALPEKTAPLDAIGDWGSKILSGSSLLSGGTKLFFGYDAFRGKDIDSKNMNGGSNSLDGMYDSQIPYIYKVMSKAAALATGEDLKAVSPARINAAAESFIGSPKSSFLTGVLTAIASDVANIIIPASDIEKSEITIFNPKTVMKSFGVITDSGMKERVQNRKFMDESHKLNMKAADIETIADKNIDLFYKENPATFMSRVEKYAEQWDYAGDEDATERLLKKAELKLNKLERKSNIPKDLSTEVKIIYYTKGTDNQAKMLKSIAGDDKRMANRIIESLYDFGMDEGKMIEIEDKYYQK